MTNFERMTNFVQWLLSAIPDFLSSEPIIYVFAFALLGYIFSLIYKLLRG